MAATEIEVISGSLATNSAPVNNVGAVEAVDGLGESVVLTAADAANGGLCLGLRQALGVLGRDVLERFDGRASRRAPDGVRAGVARGIEHEAGTGGAAPRQPTIRRA